jgi:hypothetical protein
VKKKNLAKQKEPGQKQHKKRGQYGQAKTRRKVGNGKIKLRM